MADGRPERRGILLVEDNSGDARLLREVLKDSRAFTLLHVAETGAQALAFLRQEAPYESAPRPALILLDSTLPDMNGLEVLAALRADPALTHLPVVLLLDAAAPQILTKSSDLRVNACMMKPRDFAQLEAAISGLEHSWCEIAELPKG